MEYWISQKGKKRGPLKEWDIRSLIEDEDLTEDDLIWHTDLPTWEKVSNYSAFQSYFRKEPELSPEEAQVEAVKEELKQKIEEVTGKKVPEGAIIKIEKVKKHYWVRRGFAKVLDLFLYFSAFFIIANYFGLRFVIDPNIPWLLVTFLIPFLVIEGFLLYFYGLTPGKFILGLQVKPLEGTAPLNYNRAFVRSAASWLFGMAMGMMPWFVIAMVLSYFSTKKRGITMWDAIGRTKVISLRPAKTMSIICFIFLFVVSNLSVELFTKYHEPTRKEVSKYRKELIKQMPVEIQESLREFLIPKNPTQK